MGLRYKVLFTTICVLQSSFLDEVKYSTVWNKNEGLNKTLTFSFSQWKLCAQQSSLPPTRSFSAENSGISWQWVVTDREHTHTSYNGGKCCWHFLHISENHPKHTEPSVSWQKPKPEPRPPPTKVTWPSVCASEQNVGQSLRQPRTAQLRTARCRRGILFGLQSPTDKRRLYYRVGTFIAKCTRSSCIFPMQISRWMGYSCMPLAFPLKFHLNIIFQVESVKIHYSSFVESCPLYS